MSSPVQIEIRSSVESLRERFVGEGIPRDYGFWLAGLTDGEGHFGINPSSGDGWLCIFAIKLRADDGAILEEAQRVLGVGRIRIEASSNANDRNRKPQARWDGYCDHLVRRSRNPSCAQHLAGSGGAA